MCGIFLDIMMDSVLGQPQNPFADERSSGPLNVHDQHHGSSLDLGCRPHIRRSTRIRTYYSTMTETGFSAGGTVGKNLSETRGNSFPRGIRPIWIASYPRSGNTFLRILLQNF